jgi:hypothetical protein
VGYNEASGVATLSFVGALGVLVSTQGDAAAETLMLVTGAANANRALVQAAVVCGRYLPSNLSLRL